MSTQQIITETSTSSTSQIASLEIVVCALLAGTTHSEAHLTATVRQYRSAAAPDANDADVAALVRRLTERLNTTKVYA